MLVSSLLTENSDLIHDSETMANILDDSFFFYPYLTLKTQLVFQLQSQCQLMVAFSRLIDTDEQEDILLALNGIKVNKLEGPDIVYLKTMKETKNQIVKLLIVPLNKSLLTRKVSLDLTFSSVTPIPKKGQKSLPENHHPLTLTSIVSKHGSLHSSQDCKSCKELSFL